MFAQMKIPWTIDSMILDQVSIFHSVSQCYFWKYERKEEFFLKLKVLQLASIPNSNS